jgi:hypothetical protein
MSGRCCPVCHCCPSTDLLSLLQDYMPLPPPLSSYCSYFAVVPLPPTTTTRQLSNTIFQTRHFIVPPRVGPDRPFLPSIPPPISVPIPSPRSKSYYSCLDPCELWAEGSHRGPWMGGNIRDGPSTRSPLPSLLDSDARC